MDIQIIVAYRNAAPFAARLQGWALPLAGHATRLWSHGTSVLVDTNKRTSDSRLRPRTPPA